MPHSMTDRVLERDRRLLAGRQHDLIVVHEAVSGSADHDPTKVEEAANRIAVALGYPPAFAMFYADDGTAALLAFRINHHEAFPVKPTDDVAELITWLSQAFRCGLSDGYRDGDDAFAYGKHRDGNRIVRNGSFRLPIVRVTAGNRIVAPPAPSRLLLVGADAPALDDRYAAYDVVIACSMVGSRVLQDATGSFGMLTDFTVVDRPHHVDYVAKQRPVLLIFRTSRPADVISWSATPKGTARTLEHTTVAFAVAPADDDTTMSGPAVLVKHRYAPGGGRWLIEDQRYIAPAGPPPSPAAPATLQRQPLRPASGLPLIMAEHPSAGILHDRSPVAVTVTEVMRHPLAAKHPDRARALLAAALRDGFAHWEGTGITLLSVDRHLLAAQLDDYNRHHPSRPGSD